MSVDCGRNQSARRIYIATQVEHVNSTKKCLNHKMNPNWDLLAVRRHWATMPPDGESELIEMSVSLNEGYHDLSICITKDPLTILQLDESYLIKNIPPACLTFLLIQQLSISVNWDTARNLEEMFLCHPMSQVGIAQSICGASWQITLLILNSWGLLNSPQR